MLGSTALYHELRVFKEKTYNSKAKSQGKLDGDLMDTGEALFGNQSLRLKSELTSPV